MNAKAWSLEIVRGREVGKLYALQPGETTLGNFLNGNHGIDLSEQEGDGPRRMAAQHASISRSPSGLTLRDLESPGGTFVNRQRLLGGQSKALQTGDLIQLGGVQLKVVEQGSPPSSAPSPKPQARPAQPVPVAKPAEPIKPPSPPAVERPSASTTPPRPQPAARPVPSQPVATPPRSAPTVAIPPPIPTPTTSGPVALPAPFVLASGATCRTWDDFLAVSAQRWSALREELTSGRLGSFLRSIHRPEPQTSGSPDELLDSWLGTLPTSRAAVPELEVHPSKIVVKAAPGGGIVMQSLTLTNTGYRLLRSKVRVEGQDASWIRFSPNDVHEGHVTVDQSSLSFEVQIPESLDVPKVGTFVIESNGGKQKVEVRVERPSAPVPLDLETEAPIATGVPLGEFLEKRSAAARVSVGILLGLLARLLVMIGGGFDGANSAGASPQLFGAAMVFALAGVAIAATLALKRGAGWDVLTSGFAGGCLGVFASAIFVALCRSIEPMIGTSPFVQELLWAVLGGALGFLTTLLIPHQPGVGASS